MQKKHSFVNERTKKWQNYRIIHFNELILCQAKLQIRIGLHRHYGPHLSGTRQTANGEQRKHKTAVQALQVSCLCRLQFCVQYFNFASN